MAEQKPKAKAPADKATQGVVEGIKYQTTTGHVMIDLETAERYHATPKVGVPSDWLNDQIAAGKIIEAQDE